MKKLTLILCALLLTLPAVGQTGNFISLKWYKWYVDPAVNWDPNNPGSWKAQPFKRGAGYGFNFPISPQPDPNATSPWYGYVIKPFGFPITGGPLTITVTLYETGSPVFNFMSESFNTCTGQPLAMRFYVQQGDLYNATAGTRWWSNPVHLNFQDAQNGVPVSLHVPLDPSQWSDQYGTNGSQNPAGWQNTFNAPTWIGFTMGGGCFFGHGGNVSNGTVELDVTNLEY